MRLYLYLLLANGIILVKETCDPRIWSMVLGFLGVVMIIISNFFLGVLAEKKRREKEESTWR